MAIHRRRNRDRFFRRIGCLMGGLALLAFAGLMFLAGLIGVILRLTQSPQLLGWVFVIAAVLLVLGLAALAWAGRGVRRLSRPLGDFLEAADRVAEGDYSARVAEQGPREVRSVARAFNSMATRLQAADEQRRVFLSDVTHELRTPLTIMRGNLEGMLDGVYAPDQARLKLILDETQVLSRLVDDLRTLALTESGSLVLNRQPTDLAELIQDSAEAFNSRLDGAQAVIKTKAPPDLPPVSVDPERMRQVLLNLIANAVRYTPAGGTILLRAEAVATKNGPAVEIDVQDAGAGIAPEDLPHVFDRFYKTRDSRGMGLGLSIAKSLVEAHGGTIAAESEFGQGTTIRVILPRDE
jgi:two-component system sensor histidine kinase BaeS